MDMTSSSPPRDESIRYRYASQANILPHRINLNRSKLVINIILLDAADLALADIPVVSDL